MENILVKKITEIIENMTTDEQYYLYSEYCDSCNLYDDSPEMTDSIDELFYGLKPLEILSKLEGIDLSWDYFNFNSYGHIQEWDGIADIEEVAQEIIETDNSFGNDDIQEILNTFSDLEELVDNAMEEVYDDSISYNKDELYMQVVKEIENQTNTEDEDLFYDYEEEIREYINSFIEDNQE